MSVYAGFRFGYRADSKHNSLAQLKAVADAPASV
jgi:hypothetical protein